MLCLALSPTLVPSEALRSTSDRKLHSSKPLAPLFSVQPQLWPPAAPRRSTGRYPPGRRRLRRRLLPGHYPTLIGAASRQSHVARRGRERKTRNMCTRTFDSTAATNKARMYTNVGPPHCNSHMFSPPASDPHQPNTPRFRRALHTLQQEAPNVRIAHRVNLFHPCLRSPQSSLHSCAIL